MKEEEMRKFVLEKQYEREVAKEESEEIGGWRWVLRLLLFCIIADFCNLNIYLSWTLLIFFFFIFPILFNIHKKGNLNKIYNKIKQDKKLISDWKEAIKGIIFGLGLFLISVVIFYVFIY